MSHDNTSIELARLYEAQGHLQDALSMYRELETDAGSDAAEIHAAVKRLEKAMSRPDDTGSNDDQRKRPSRPRRRRKPATPRQD